MTVQVRAKFRCDSITHLINQIWDADLKQSIPTPARSIKMSPVYGNGDPNHENTKFWKASPSGSFEINVVNAAAAEAFEVGKEYYLDFTPATGFQALQTARRAERCGGPFCCLRRAAAGLQSCEHRATLHEARSTHHENNAVPWVLAAACHLVLR